MKAIKLNDWSATNLLSPLFPFVLYNDQCDILLAIINSFWLQAGIEWDLVEVLEENFQHLQHSSLEEVNNIKEGIWKLDRDASTGMMRGKDRRRTMFLEKLLVHHKQALNTYDIYFFDFIGQASQGCCISRDVSVCVSVYILCLWKMTCLLTFFLSTYLSIYLSVRLSVCLSVSK